jgi:hypothetical protein
LKIKCDFCLPLVTADFPLIVLSLPIEELSPTMVTTGKLFSNARLFCLVCFGRIPSSCLTAFLGLVALFPLAWSVNSSAVNRSRDGSALLRFFSKVLAFSPTFTESCCNVSSHSILRCVVLFLAAFRSDNIRSDKLPIVIPSVAALSATSLSRLLIRSALPVALLTSTAALRSICCTFFPLASIAERCDSIFPIKSP